MFKALLAFLVALCLAACATSTNLLSEVEIAGMRIELVDIVYKPDAIIWWRTAAREFVEREQTKMGAAAGMPKRPL